MRIVPLVLSTLTSLQAVPTSDRLEVVGGEKSGPGVWPAVVAIGVNGKICTGSLLNPTLILTAAHCVSGLSKEDQPNVYIGQNLDSELQSIQYVSKWEVHPKYCPSSKCEIPEFDFAFLKLEAPVSLDSGDEYAKLLVQPEEWKQTLNPNNPVWLVGYGKDSDGNTGQKHHVMTNITRVLDTGRGFFAGEKGKDTCDGDSGGPAYVRLSDKSWRIAGILSAGSSPCGAGGYFASAVDAVPWLKERAGFQIELACEDSTCLRNEAQKLSKSGGCTVDSGPRTWSWLLLLLGLARVRRGRPHQFLSSRGT